MLTAPTRAAVTHFESALTLILSEQEVIEQLGSQLTALASELASLREQIGRSSRNSS